MSEHLKPIDLIDEPDPRFAGYTIRERGMHEARPYTIADYHQWIAASTLHEIVPKDIRQAFATGQNLMLYSWFVYPFLASAQLHFAGCIEHALRVRLGLDRELPTRVGLGELLDRARKARLLQGIRFRDAAHPGWMPGPSEIESHEDWFFDKMSEILKRLRNNLAHGRPMLLPDGGAFMRLAADAINHVFDPGRDT